MRASRILVGALVIAVAALMALPATALALPSAVGASVGLADLPGPAVASPSGARNLGMGVPISIPYTELGRSVHGAVATGPAGNTTLQISVALAFANSSELYTLLGQLQDPHSSNYHHYVTASEFDAQFGQPASVYAAASSFFGEAGATDLTTYADHLTISFRASTAVASALFHTGFDTYRWGQRTFVAPTGTPALPASLAPYVAGVDGLSTYSALTNHALLSPPSFRIAPTSRALAPAVTSDGYLAPVGSGTAQLEYGPDFQVAYDELSLFATEGYPTTAVVATILWSGQYEGTSPQATSCGTIAAGQNVGPFVPSDVTDFYNETLPAGEPHSVVAGVPVDGAPWPSCFASYDTTQSDVENTLDLEMVGSTAPGSSIFNVYGPAPQDSDLDDAFANILSPNGTAPAALANVSVITNSWGGTDANDSGWYGSVVQAAARGITVLASSGDSGSNPNGYEGGLDPPGQVTFFPSSMAYNNFGVVAVGGTTVTLDPSSLQLTGDVVWNESSTFADPPAGSTGGISQIFAAPTWQNNSEANTVIAGAGRGVPDVAAVANNTLMTLTFSGFEYEASNATYGGAYLPVAGTSIASPLTAGMIAMADFVMAKFGDPWLGFVDPQLYALANESYTPAPPINPSSPTGYYVTPYYDSILPTSPFYDVTQGQNFAFLALPAYDLTTGWGTIDAYNYTMYFVNYQPLSTPGDLEAVGAAFNLTGLAVTSTLPSAFGGGVNTFFNASIQQNFFLADALGAPIYWVQNVVYINWTPGSPGAWQMNFSGWVVYPFYGLYANEVVYEYNFPLVGSSLSTPLAFDIRTTLTNTSVFDGQGVDFSFGIPGTHNVTLPVPGASYIIGSLWYNYSWGGVTYTNGPYPAPYGGPGGLDPQFGIVGGPSGGIGNFITPTAGNLQLEFQRFGSDAWVPGTTEAYGEGVDETGETASNITWTLVSPANQATGTPANWSLSYQNGATEQGVLEYDSASTVAAFQVVVNETGLPASGYLWTFATTSGQDVYSFGSQNVAALANGTYDWFVFAGATQWRASPSQGVLTINGAGAYLTIAFTLVTYNVTVDALGLPSGINWSVTYAAPYTDFAGMVTADTPSLVLNLPNASFQFTYAGTLNWSAHPVHASLNVEGRANSTSVSFTPPPKYVLTFFEAGLPAGVEWTLNITGLATNLTAIGSSIVVPIVNGSYQWAAYAHLAGWFAAGGRFAVDGGPEGVTVNFRQDLFPVEFSETGLPAQALWGVQIVGGPYLSGPPGGLSWATGNGTYNYSVITNASGLSAAPSQGQFTIDGAGTSLSVVFSPVTFVVTFVESGLASGANWGVSLTPGVSNRSLTSTVGFSLLNGSYTFQISVPSGYAASPASGLLQVAGRDASITVSFQSGHSSTSAGGPFGLGDLGYLAIALAIVAAVLILLVITRRPPPRASTGANSATRATP